MPQPSVPKMEEEVLAWWDAVNAFERSVAARPEDRPFVFYDGPPFATGTPHYGHLLASTLKDLMPRYFTMKGYRVQRRWGWDCHGLPIENLIENELGINSRREIEELGIEKFNAACRASVLRFAEEWKRTIRRIGRWVDMEHAYRTMDNEYIESVWWIFSELWKKNLVYEAERISYFCTRCSTPLAEFEIHMTPEETWKTVTDPSVIVKFKHNSEPRTFFLAWTTTPWTLPANAALAVHADATYIKAYVPERDEFYIFAEALKNEVLSGLAYPVGGPHTSASVEFVSVFKGKELVGRQYQPLYTFLPAAGAHRIIAAPFVSLEEGTGIVHIAPGFGGDDFEISKKEGLPLLLTVNDEGRFIPEVKPWAGIYVKDADPNILDDLRRRGLIFRERTVDHSYPHCWRCATPLIYKAQPAWFVRVEPLRAEMLEANESIVWRPEHLQKGRFGKGLESAPDWCISRTRFWGAPLPVWRCGACGEIEVLESRTHLVARSRAPLPQGADGMDLHRPYIDRVTLPCKKCNGAARRVSEVFDCWFESGSMPYASWHYPFENKQIFEHNFPAEFIAEGQDQTRGWFSRLHVLAVALFGKPAFKHVIVNGIILAEDGSKMSKSKGNFPDPWLLLDTYGADAVRAYLLQSPAVAAESLNFSEKGVEEMMRKVVMLTLNVLQFYKMYADTRGAQPVSGAVGAGGALDRWITARLHETARIATEALDDYRPQPAMRALVTFIDDLSTWYVRRSRERFKARLPAVGGGENGVRSEEIRAAAQTLHIVLRTLSKLLAPFTPFLAEKIYQEFTSAPFATDAAARSVHFEDWPGFDAQKIDRHSIETMAVTREICSAALNARAEAGIAVRQPLTCLRVRRGDLHLTDECIALIKDEVNVEQITIESTGATLEVALDTSLTPELRAKGMVRELVRHINQLRKEAGLTVQDAILLHMEIPDQRVRAIIEGGRGEVARATGATDIMFERSDSDNEKTVNIGESALWIGLGKA